MRIYDYMKGILGAMGVGEDVGVPEPSWRIEEYLEAIYEAIKAGGGGGGADLTTFLAPQFSSGTPYSAGNYVVNGGALYKFTEDHAAGAWTGTDAEQTLTATELEALYAALANKANVDGSYSTLTSGNAEQLVSTVGVNDKTPYLFRTTGGSADVGDRVKVSEITGGTVAWNQLQANTKSYTTQGTTYTYNNGKLTIKTDEGGATANNWWLTANDEKWDWIANHVYLVDVGNSTYSFTAGLVAHWYLPAPTGYASININKPVAIIKPTFTTNVYLQFVVYSGLEVDTTFIPQVFDLTQMFGSTIADYIYSLEQNTEGAGVAWFRKLFPKDYYAYDAGSLLSVKTTAHKTIGFNAYDNSTGKAKVVGGQVYQITGTYTALSLDGSSITPDASGYFTPSASGELTVTGGNATDTCIHLKWDGERDGEYEPYEANTYPLDDVELRGIPKLDANNNLYFDGDSYEADGTVTRKYGIVDLGTLSYTYENSNGRFFTSGLSSVIKRPLSNSDRIQMVAGRIFENSVLNRVHVNAGYDKVMAVSSLSGALFLRDSSYTDAATFKTAMSGVYLVYELATPTTESADPYQETQVCNDFGTEEFVDSRTVPMPVGANALYQANLRAKLEMAPDSPDGDGDYIVRQTDGLNEYVAVSSNSTISGLSTRCPACPTDTDGTFVLKATVSSGAVTYAWTAES